MLMSIKSVTMKIAIILFLLVITLLPLASSGQLNNGGLYSGFGGDAETRANYMKYGLVTRAGTNHDWFPPSRFGNNVNGTANAAIYLFLVQSGRHISFTKPLSSLLPPKA